MTFGSKCQKDKVAGLGNGLKRMPVYVIYMAAACNHFVTWSVSVTRVNSHKFHANGVYVCVCVCVCVCVTNHDAIAYGTHGTAVSIERKYDIITVA